MLWSYFLFCFISLILRIFENHERAIPVDHMMDDIMNMCVENIKVNWYGTWKLAKYQNVVCDRTQAATNAPSASVPNQDKHPCNHSCSCCVHCLFLPISFGPTAIYHQQWLMVGQDKLFAVGKKAHVMTWYLQGKLIPLMLQVAYENTSICSYCNVVWRACQVPLKSAISCIHGGEFIRHNL